MTNNTCKEIAFLLYTNPDGLTGHELHQLARARRPIKLQDPAISDMLSQGLIELAGDRYTLTDIGHMAYID